MSTLRNIIFIGGIHGVGKSTICKVICQELNFEYLSASEVLKWQEINLDQKNKKVVDIPNTQDRLINGLAAIVKSDKNYLLDGHFSLLNTKDEIIPVPIETFQKINPKALSIVLGDIDEIRSRIALRDKRSYDKKTLDLMQKKELEHAQLIASKLAIPLFIGNQTDYSNIKASLELLKSNQ